MMIYTSLVAIIHTYQ